MEAREIAGLPDASQQAANDLTLSLLVATFVIC